MPRFQYEGRDTKRVRKGTIQADTKREAVMKLREQGIRVLNLNELPETTLTKEITIGKPVKRPQLIMFLQQFSTLLRAGVTIVDAIHILSQQVESKPFRKILSEIADDLRGGGSLSDAMAKHPKAFEPLTLNMIAAGEASGNIDDSLDRLAMHYEKSYATRQKVVSAMVYPVVVLVLAFGVVIFLLVSIVPMFVDMFDSLGAELPAITLFVLGASQFMQNYWYLFIGFVLLLVLAIYFMHRSKEGKYILDTILLRMPLIGDLMKKSALASMTRTLSSLFTSSVPILQAMAMVERVVDNEVIKRVVRESRDALQKGNSIAGPMTGHWAFPPLIPHMIAIGEQTGALDQMLGKVAEFYEKEVDTATERLKSLIEPLMMVFLAVIIGTIVMAIMVPMFSMYEQVG
ncbi:type IV pilus assembly protein PilC [Bhargavaea ginsengi]|uniref:Type IV pilus assembly protein PilC n=1 Tax=Bhargavaea ginsengi TaxID=426757 RepID=A0A1H6X731_9BACL|nr:type II secretion system F family protein [Bhargavaea ginsengi]MCM3086602.1 type II secretion system F family protein [Bhargavaea ginsengi]SEJ25031.1 type IV pilus assembly protein PilC [Bhargavaea ginsengi]